MALWMPGNPHTPPTMPLAQFPIVGGSKIYNSMIFIENGRPRRARAPERPIMSRMVHEEGGQ
jgi:hypothetical protein